MYKLILPLSLIMLMSCDFEPAPYPSGPGSANLVNITLSENELGFIDSTGYEKAETSGGSFTYDMVGSYMDVSNEFTMKFNNYTPISALYGVDTVIVKSAWIELHLVKVWSETDPIFIHIGLKEVPTDTAITWLNSFDAGETDSLWQLFEEYGTTPMIDDTLINLLDSTITIPVSLDMIQFWRTNGDANNGIIIFPADTLTQTMASFYAYDYYDFDSHSPVMKLDCEIILDTTLVDTGYWPQDSVFTVYSTADLQHSVNSFVPGDSSFVVAQGGIIRPWLSLNSVKDTLNAQTLINKAVLKIDVEADRSDIDEYSKTIYVKYSYSDDWTSYLSTIDTYLYGTAALYDSTISLSFDVTKILQYYISGGRADMGAKLRFNFSSESNGFSRLYLRPETVNFDITYTEIESYNDENQ